MQSAQFQVHFDCELTHWWFVARRRILMRLVLRLLPPDRSTGIVDVGCGAGANIASLSAAYCCTGVDRSSEAIELAKRRFPRVHFICDDALEALKCLAPTTKMVLLTDVLEHVADDRTMLARLVGAVRAGTFFLITVPADRSLWSLHDESHGHYRRYNRQQFQQLWAGLPVTPSLVSYFNSRLYRAVKFVRTVNRLRGRSSGAAGTDLSIPAAPLNWALERVFAGEANVLADLLEGSRRRSYRYGVSLLVVCPARVY